MLSDEEDNDELLDLEAIRDLTSMGPKCDQMQVSTWDDDNEGIEEARAPADPDQKAVLDAAEQGDLDKIKALCSINPALIECQDKDGYTPLHRACYGNHVHLVEYLLNNGARVDAKTQDNWEPLHSACCWNNVECAVLLIARGANINARSKGDQTPLHLVSATSYNSPCLQLLLLHPDTDSTIRNSSGDTAEDIAKRSGRNYPIFEITEACLNQI